MDSCKTTSRLISDAMDRTLQPTERLRLKFHLLICRGCRRYQQQTGWLREACRKLK